MSMQLIGCTSWCSTDVFYDVIRPRNKPKSADMSTIPVHNGDIDIKIIHYLLIWTLLFISELQGLFSQRC